MKHQIFQVLTCMFILSACGLPSNKEKIEEESASSALKMTNNGTPILARWPLSRLPLQLEVSTDFNKEEFDAIDEVSTEWSRGIDNEIDFINVRGQIVDNNSQSENADDYLDDNEIGIFIRKKWFADKPKDSVAITHYQISGEGKDVVFEFSHADIIINGEFHKVSTKGEKGSFDLKSIILHEMGHLLGLDHISSRGRKVVMFTAMDTNEIKRELTTIDLFAMRDLYGLDVQTEEVTPTLARDVLIYNNAASQLNYKSQKITIKGSIHLMKDGTCIHTQQGVETKRHHVNLSSMSNF